MFTRVLIYYDGSLASRRAFARGVEVARLCAAKISLLSILSQAVPAEVAWAGVAGSTCFEDPRVEKESWLCEAIQHLEAQELNLEVLRAHGDAIDEIADCARRLAADLIVVGEYPKPPDRRWLSASARNPLAARVNCCVLIAR